jgi:DNA mismatch repair protein MutS
MPFQSILFLDLGEDPSKSRSPELADFRHDLNLDQIIEAITAPFKDYDLAPFYHVRLHDSGTITYRQEIMRELENKHCMQVIKDFSGRMRKMRECLAQAKQFEYYKYTKERRFLSAVQTYCEAVEQLSARLGALDPRSEGMHLLREYLSDYLASPLFKTVLNDTQELIAALSAIHYSLFTRNRTVTIRDDDERLDYSTTVENAFEKFRQRSARHYQLEDMRWEGMNHIEEQILDRVALLHPDVFQSLDRFCEAHADYLDATISRFDTEVQFYVAYLNFADNFRRSGLSFCYPEILQNSKDISARNTFDIALANKLINQKAAIVVNDFCLSGSERVFVVSGPNQGGKTTFARMIGQLHYLACLGCSVPGAEVRLFLFDQLFTHFERQEKITSLRGKLQDDLFRIHNILHHATTNSLIIMNEMFSSTSVKDALYLSKEMMAKISNLDLLCVWVTFLDELASFNKKTVSMVSTVNPENPAIRTFRLERRPADGLAYAMAIAQKYRVTYESLKERIKS